MELHHQCIIEAVTAWVPSVCKASQSNNLDNVTHIDSYRNLRVSDVLSRGDSR